LLLRARPSAGIDLLERISAFVSCGGIGRVQNTMKRDWIASVLERSVTEQRRGGGTRTKWKTIPHSRDLPIIM
jgi:hypothetical protein